MYNSMTNSTTKKLLSIFLVLALVFTTIGVTTCTAQAATQPTKMRLKVSTRIVDVKGIAKIKVYKIKPARASKSVTWKSSNTSIATVSSKGTIRGKKEGVVRITATSKLNKNVKKSVFIRVKELKATNISVSPTSATMKSGAKKTIAATVKWIKSSYHKTTKWSSSDTSIATVSSKGVVTAKNLNATKYKDGKATVTITASNDGKTAKSEITVHQLATGISLSKDSMNLSVGETALNKGTITNNPYTLGVTYASSNPSIASVDTSGVVTGNKLGTAVISVKSKDNAKTVKYNVTVGKWVVLRAQILGSNPEFDLDRSASKYKEVSKRGTMEFDSNDIDKLFGTNGMNIWNAGDVQSKLANESMDYDFGNLTLKKSGSEVYFGYYNTNSNKIYGSYWYLRANSFQRTGNDYTITLYSTPNAQATEETKTISYNSEQQKISFSVNGTNIEMLLSNSGNTVTMVTKEQNVSNIRASITKETSKYDVTVNSTDVSNDNIIFYEYR